MFGEKFFNAFLTSLSKYIYVLRARKIKYFRHKPKKIVHAKRTKSPQPFGRRSL